jgi:hypothetical protein
MSGYEHFGDGMGSPTADLDGNQTAFTYMPNGKPILGVKTDTGGPSADNYYRPPRARRATLDLLTPGAKSRMSGTSVDFPYTDSPGQATAPRGGSHELVAKDDTAIPHHREGGDSEDGGLRTDYAVREVDQYYRGQALSDQPTRKLKTGPTNPEGPAANAQSWFQRLIVGVQGGKSKQKEQSKGFEVVRSAPMQRQMMQPGDGLEEHEMVASPPMQAEPYHDSPPLRQGEAQVMTGASRSLSPEQQPRDKRHLDFGITGPYDETRPSFEPDTPTADRLNFAEQDTGYGFGGRPSAEHAQSGPRQSNDTGSSSHYNTTTYNSAPVKHSGIPSLAPIDPVGGLDLPSRFNSHRTSHQSTQPSIHDPHDTTKDQSWLRGVDELTWPSPERTLSHEPQPQAISPPPASYRTPNVPRRSSRRTPSGDQSQFRVGQQSGGGNDFEDFDGGPSLGAGRFLDEREERWDHGGRF